jgi:hypothetical protein
MQDKIKKDLSGLEQEFCAFAAEQMRELRHPYCRSKTLSFSDVGLTARLFIRILRLNNDSDNQGLADQILKNFSKFRQADNDIDRQDAVSILAEKFEAYFKKLYQILLATPGWKAPKQHAWNLLKPSISEKPGLNIVSEVVFTELIKDREDFLFWENQEPGDAKLFRTRISRNILKHTARKPDFREIVLLFDDVIGAYLYVTDRKSADLEKVIYADEESRKARDTRALFESSVINWEKSYQPASKEHVAQFYQYRPALSINASGILFLLESEMHDAKLNAHFGSSVSNTRRWRLRWMEVFSSEACRQALTRALRDFDDGAMAERLTRDTDTIWRQLMPSRVPDPKKEARDHTLQLAIDLCSKPDSEFQRHLLGQLQTIEPENSRELLSEAYRVSPIQSDEAHTYLADVYCNDDLTVEVRRILAIRILNHYFAPFSPTNWPRSYDQEELNRWRTSISTKLFANEMFRELTCIYLKTIFDESWNPNHKRTQLQIAKFEIEILNLLCAQDMESALSVLSKIYLKPSDMKGMDAELLRRWRARVRKQRQPKTLPDQSDVPNT